MHIGRRSSADRRTLDKVRLDLPKLLRQWDPIGIYDDDASESRSCRAYDDLVVPLRDQLRQSTRPEALASALEQVLADDSGLPKVSNIDAFAPTVR